MQQKIFYREHLVKNQGCAENFNLGRFKIIKSCRSLFDLV